MKRELFVRLFVFVFGLIIITQVSAQHFISVQSDDKQPFAIQVNGISFNSTKTGSVRVANLAVGSYNLIITPAGKKYPPQNFTCIIDKSDESYSLQNLGKKGWILKNTKSTEIIASTTIAVPAVAKTEIPAAPNAFAQMLAQVIDDPELLKKTPWVLNTKEYDASAAAVVPADSQAEDTTAYVPDTKGVIKAVEKPVKEGTELVFVDFNAKGGDTIHVLIPSVGGTGSTATNSTVQSPPVDIIHKIPAVNVDSSGSVQLADSTARQNGVIKTDSVAAVKNKVVPTAQEPAFDTSANRKMNNPFFKKDSVAGSVTKDPAVAVNADTPLKNDSTVTQPQNTAVQPVSANTVKAAVKEDCKKMLSDNDAEKLKHKIYLETDEAKIMDITKKALAGKCINTAQVKQLATFFLSDDARYNFFFTVYPFVYDFGNFGSLDTFMIDRKYKNMFHSMLK